jgi:hypothetical protein
LSKEVQKLRDEGLVEFLAAGRYLLLDAPINVEDEELPVEAIDLAIRRNRLKLGIVDTASTSALARRRQGQERLRTLTLQNYSAVCAVCDVDDLKLLIASHVVGWAASPEHRGDLANVICLCRFHDALFEAGYWSLTADLRVVKRCEGLRRMVRAVLDGMSEFRVPSNHPPLPEYVDRHRRNAGLDRLS